MRIILGSGSEEKIEILKSALKELHLVVEVKGVKVGSEIPDQPLDKETTLKGAKNRAKNAKSKNPDADFWVGLEGGLHDYGEGYHLVTYACLIDKSGDEYVGEGVEIHLPESVSEEVKNGGWFGDVIRVYAKEYEINVNLITRETPFIQVIHNAYANYLKAKGNLENRKKVAAVIFNNDKQVLLVQLQSYGEEDWNIPGGGIDEGEEPEVAIKRELFEELGTDKFEVLEKSDVIIEYEWPDFVVAKRLVKEGKTYKGQTQMQFVARLIGKDSDIKLQASEIRKYKWVDYKDLEQHLNFPNQWENIKAIIGKYSAKLD